jgi:hypothetical protein
MGAAALLWLLRGSYRILHPTLWAEDGQVFLAGAYHDPLTSLVHPYRGYLHLVPRLIAAAASPLPIAWLPTVYALAAVGTVVAITGLVLSDRMRRLLPRPWQPALALAVLTLLPAADEPFGNLANLIFYAGLGLLLLSLCDDPRTRRGRRAELVALAILGLSGPFALPLGVPAYLARWWRLRTAHSLSAGATVLVVGAVQWVLVVWQRVGTAQVSARALPAFAGRSVAGSWLFGDRWTGHWTAAMTLAVVAFLVAFTAVAWRREAVGPVIGVLVTLAGALVAWGYFAVHANKGERHVLLPLATIGLLLVAGLAHHVAWRRWLAAGCLLAGLGGIAHTAAIRPLPFRPIGPLADCLAAHHGPCTVQVNPSGARWAVILSPR